MTQPMQGQRIIVTGAATGIGKATARLLAERGASVALWDIDADTAQANADAISSNQARCIGIRADVSSAAEVAAATQQTLEALGGLDAAFNNAGIGAPSVPLDEIDEAEFDQIIGVNLKGVWLCMKHQMAHMRKNGGGVIVNNASIAGLVALSGQGGYAASKHGVVGLSKVGAIEGAAANIRVNSICPGAVRTPILEHLHAAGVTDEMLAGMSPQNRIAEPAEIAEAAAFLLSPNSSFVTGAALSIDGGWTAQ